MRGFAVFFFPVYSSNTVSLLGKATQKYPLSGIKLYERKTVMSKKSSAEANRFTFLPGVTPEEREKQMIALAVDLVERQLRDGTAAPSVINHYLKLGSTLANLERAKLENDTALAAAKAEQIREQKHSDELYANALEALKIYKGLEDG